MDLIQYGNSIWGKSSIKGDQAITSKLSNKWTHNGIHMPSPKSKGKEKSSDIKESSKMENTIKNKHPSNEITLPFSKYEEKERFNSTGESLKYEYGGSIEVDWEG